MCMMISLAHQLNILISVQLTIAGFDLYHKSVNNLPSLIMNIFRDSKSKDFYKFLIEQDMKVIIPLKMITEEFPKLYDGLPEDFKFSHSND